MRVVLVYMLQFHSFQLAIVLSNRSDILEMAKFTGMLIEFLFASIALFPSIQCYECTDFTIDKCLTGPDDLLETVKDIDEKQCQFYCNVIYNDVCTFYIMDRKDVVCKLMKSPFHQYLKDCEKYGGPPSPSVHRCLSTVDEGKVCQF